jgi:hypothetical protein
MRNSIKPSIKMGGYSLSLAFGSHTKRSPDMASTVRKRYVELHYAITLLQSASRNNEIEAALQLLNSHLEKLAPADEKARSEVSKWHRGVFERDTVEAFRVDFKWPKNWIDLAQVTKSWPQSVDYNLHMFSYFFRSPTISPRIGYASVVAAYLFSQSNRQAP